MLPPFCTTNQFCEGERNFGCAERACFGGICANGPNPDNPDPSRSEQCHGFPVTEFEGEQIPPHRATSGGRGCFELQCRDVPLASVVAPNFDCVAVPHNELCADGLFCNGPPLCDPREICGGCNETQLARTLLRSATYLASAPPPADRLIAGCARLSPSEVCDDGIDCTADSCLEGADGDGTGSCQNIADERRCAAAAGGDWSACDPGFTCLVEEGCEPVDNPCVSEHGCELECLDYDGFRQCRADPDSCGTEECFDEGFVTVELSDLTNLCPFHPDGTVPQGDRDFDGHGPLIAIDVSLSHRGGDVLATVRFTAQETRRDFSTIDVSWTRVVATTPFDILGIVSETTGRALGASSPGGTAGIACGDCGVVSFYRFEGVITDAKVRGDTPDGDISDDANCSEDTLLQWLELSTVELAVRKDGCGLI